MAYIIRFTKKDGSYGYQLISKDYITQTRAREFIDEQKAFNMVQYCNIKLLVPSKNLSEVVYDNEKGFIQKDVKDEV